MRTSFKNRLQMFRRVRDLIQPMANDPAIAVPARELDGVIERLTLHARQQDAHGRQSRHGTEIVLGLARTLREDLVRPVVLLARTIPADRWAVNAPGARSLSSLRRRDFEGLLATARGLHDAAIVHEQALVATGLPVGHLAKLVAGADALGAALDARQQQWLKRASSTAGAREESRRGMRIVRLVDSLVRPLIRTDAGMLAAWEQAQRLPRVSVSGGGVEGGEGAEGGASPTPPTSPVVSIGREASAEVKAA
jgi:hypothetical protein